MEQLIVTNTLAVSSLVFTSLLYYWLRLKPAKQRLLESQLEAVSLEPHPEGQITRLSPVSLPMSAWAYTDFSGKAQVVFIPPEPTPGGGKKFSRWRTEWREFKTATR